VESDCRMTLVRRIGWDFVLCCEKMFFRTPMSGSLWPRLPPAHLLLGINKNRLNSGVRMSGSPCLRARSLLSGCPCAREGGLGILQMPGSIPTFVQGDFVRVLTCKKRSTAPWLGRDVSSSTSLGLPLD